MAQEGSEQVIDVYDELIQALDRSQPVPERGAMKAELYETNESVEDVADKLRIAEEELSSASKSASLVQQQHQERTKAETAYLRSHLATKEEQIDSLRSSLMDERHELTHAADNAAHEAGQLREQLAEHKELLQQTQKQMVEHRKEQPSQTEPESTQQQTQMQMGHSSEAVNLQPSTRHQALALIQSAMSQLPLLYASSPMPAAPSLDTPGKASSTGRTSQQPQSYTQACTHTHCSKKQSAQPVHNAKTVAALANAQTEIRALRGRMCSRLHSSKQ